VDASPDGSILVTGGVDTTVLVWDLAAMVQVLLLLPFFIGVYTHPLIRLCHVPFSFSLRV
jgi:WD40 repeat protein